MFRARLIQSKSSHPISWRLILILSSHLRLPFQNLIFPSDLRSKPCMNLFSLPYVLHAPFISSWFDHPNNIWCGVQIMKLLIMQSSPFPSCLVPIRPISTCVILFLLFLALNFRFPPKEKERKLETGSVGCQSLFMASYALLRPLFLFTYL